MKTMSMGAMCALLSALLLSACELNPVRKCSQDSDCLSAGRCDLPTGDCVIASIDAGAPTRLAVQVSRPARVKPDGGVWLVPDDEQSYLRDEKVLVTAIATGTPPTPFSFQYFLSSFADGGATPVTMVSAPCPAGVDAGTCATAELDLSLPALDGLRGTFGLKVTAREFTARTVEASTTLPVTRVRWALKLGESLLATPAIGRSGILYGGTSGAGSKLFSVAPDGSLRWGALPFSPLSASPAVGSTQAEDVIYFGGTGPDAFLQARKSADGSPLQRCREGGSPYAGDFRGGLALYSLKVGSTTQETVSAVANEDTGFIASLRPLDAASRCLQTPASGLQQRPGSLVTDGVELFLGDALGDVRAFSFQVTGWQAKASWPNGGRVIVGNAGQRVSGLAISGDRVVGTVVPHGAFAINIADGGVDTPFPGGLSSPPGSPVVDAEGFVYFGDGANRLLKGKPGSASIAAVGPTAAPVTAAPLLAEGGLVYSVDGAGTLQVWDRNLAPRWSGSLGTAGFSASPTLDCARGPNGAATSGPGTLYVAAEDGILHAIVVDSPRLDSSARWPKYQHDVRNTGNSLTPLSCP